MNGLYWDRWYNNESVVAKNSVLYENYLLGSPRMRQLRVRNDSCEVHKDFQRAIFTCYNFYAESFEERDVMENGKNDSGFEWREIKSFAKNDVWGKPNNLIMINKNNDSCFEGIISTYSGEGGYIVDLSLNRTIATQRIKDLKKNLWIDRGTRVVFIDFTTYNPNINLYVVTKLIAEFPATGGLITSWQFRTLNLLENSTDAPIALYICFAFFLLFIIYYTIEELVEIKTLGFVPYFRTSGWNFLDIFTIFISVMLIFFLFYRKYVINKIFSEATHTETGNGEMGGLQNSSSVALHIETYQFDTLGFWSAQFSNMLAVLSFVAWVKLFKYISFNKTMSQLSSTLSRVSASWAFEISHSNILSYSALKTSLASVLCFS